MRGTFANVRLRNQLVPGSEGSWTAHLPDGEQMSIFDAADALPRRGRAADRARRQGVRLRLVARLGRQGPEAARRARRDRRELRAHPPLEPGRHGHPAAAVRGRRVGVTRSASPGLEAFDIEAPAEGDRETTVTAITPEGETDEFQGDGSHRHAPGVELLPSRRHPAVRPAPAGSSADRTDKEDCFGPGSSPRTSQQRARADRARARRACAPTAARASCRTSTSTPPTPAARLFETERDQSMIERLEDELEAIARAEQRLDEGNLRPLGRQRRADPGRRAWRRSRGPSAPPTSRRATRPSSAVESRR